MWNVTDWQKVVFSDESRFVLGTDDNRVRVWRHPEERERKEKIELDKRKRKEEVELAERKRREEMELAERKRKEIELAERKRKEEMEIAERKRWPDFEQKMRDIEMEFETQKKLIELEGGHFARACLDIEVSIDRGNIGNEVRSNLSSETRLTQG
ncbi:hypothetical protein TNCV_1220521 [Trichonephila clavipes]|nr:hypothetical protein TNCV_1220521 [Trichonephila clavipes]